MYSATEFRREATSGHRFVRSVLKARKVFLIGDAEEIVETATNLRHQVEEWIRATPPELL